MSEREDVIDDSVGPAACAAVGAVTTREKLKTLFKESSVKSKELAAPVAGEIVKLILGLVPIMSGAAEVGEAAEPGLAMKLAKLLGPKAAEKISTLINKDGDVGLQIPGWVDEVAGIAGLLGIEGAPALVPAVRLEYIRGKQLELSVRTVFEAAKIVGEGSEVAAIREKVVGFTNLVKEKIATGFAALTKPNMVEAAQVFA